MSQFEEKARELYEVCWRSTTSQEAEAAISLALGEAFEAGRNSMCQADLGAKCGDGVAPKGALQLSDIADALRDRAAYFREQAAGVFPGENPLVMKAHAKLLDHLAATLRGQIEEPALAGDEVDAASASASLTPPNTHEKAHSASVAPKCDCHLHTHQVCDICQGIERKPQEADEISP